MQERTVERLNRATGLVTGDRNESYGDALCNMRRTAQMWSAILGRLVTPKEVAMCMVAVKLAREAHAPREDNLDDILGWGLVAIECQNEEIGGGAC